MQDPAAFAAQHTAHFGSAGAVPVTQLLLIDCPEPAHLLITLAACPRTIPEAAEPNCAASAPVHPCTQQPAPSLITSEVTSKAESAKFTAPAPEHTRMGQPAAEGAATDMQAQTGASAELAPGRGGALPCQLTIERFDWRSTQPEVLELAAWDARNRESAVDAGKGGMAEAPEGQPCVATNGNGGASGSKSRACSTVAGQPEPETGRAYRDDPASATQQLLEQPEWSSTVCDSSRTCMQSKDPALLQLATGTCTGSQLDLRRGRHLLRLRAGFGRACTVELRSGVPFCAGDAVQVGCLPCLSGIIRDVAGALHWQGNEWDSRE